MIVHAVLYFERYCSHCRRRLSLLVHDYGPLEYHVLDAQIGQRSFPLEPMTCPTCGRQGMPEEMVLKEVDRKEIIARKKIGSKELPVMGDSKSYGVVRIPEEQDEYDRGMDKVEPFFRKQTEDFWRKYTDWAIPRWEALIRDIALREFEHGYNVLGLDMPGTHLSTAAWRKDALARFKTEDDRRRAWRALNDFLVHREFLWLPVDHWPIKEWIATYGRERVAWLTLNFPLPEEWESLRTEKIGEVVRKHTGETGTLFARIGDLSRQLDRQRRRAEELARMVRELRQENARLQEALSVARAQAKTQTVYERDPEDVRRIARLKGLVSELRAEVARLEAMLPPEQTEEPTNLRPEPAPVETQEDVQDYTPYLAGKTVAVFGRLGQPMNVPCAIRWHDGNRPDQEMESLAQMADVLVVLTRLTSHAVMWRLKEVAADRGVLLLFLRETGIERILAAAGRAMAIGSEKGQI